MKAPGGRWITLTVAEPPQHMTRSDGSPADLDAMFEQMKKADVAFNTPVEKPKVITNRYAKVRVDRTHCLRGHPRTPENRGAAGGCLACKRFTSAARRAELIAQRGPKPPKIPKPPKPVKPPRVLLSESERRDRKAAQKRRERAARNQCSRGHKLTPDNVAAVWGGNRQCRICLEASGRTLVADGEDRRARDAARKRERYWQAKAA